MNLAKRIIYIAVTAIICFALIFVANRLTKNKVAANEENEAKAAIEAVYPGVYSYDEAKYREDYLSRYLAENGYEDDQVLVHSITFARNDIRDVQGVVVDVRSYKKYGGIIRMLVGIQNDGTVNAYRILRNSDAKDLEFKVQENEFAGQFEGVRTDRFTLVNYNASLPSEIAAATGAEDASQAVVRAVNASILANIFIDEYYGGGLN